MKTLEFLYQETQIHFLLNPTNNNVMVNATEMAKAFNKRIDHFLKSDHAKSFINVLLSTPYGGNKDTLTKDEIVRSNKKAGTYFNRLLALKFAAWLCPEFEVWIYSKLDEIIFGHYKIHWDAHQLQEAAKEKEAILRPIILANPTPELVKEFLEAQETQKNAKRTKANAIKNQYKIDFV